MLVYTLYSIILFMLLIKILPSWLCVLPWTLSLWEIKYFEYHRISMNVHSSSSWNPWELLQYLFWVFSATIFWQGLLPNSYFIFSLIQNKEINKFNFMKPLPNKRTALIIMIMVLQSIFWKVQTFREETLTSHRKSVF